MACSAVQDGVVFFFGFRTEAAAQRGKQRLTKTFSDHLFLVQATIVSDEEWPLPMGKAAFLEAMESNEGAACSNKKNGLQKVNTFFVGSAGAVSYCQQHASKALVVTHKIETINFIVKTIISE